MTHERPMSAREVAAALGISLDTFYRTRRRYHAEGMPLPLSQHRPFRFHRGSMQAWLGRHHPLAPKRPANDSAPPTAPTSDDAHRAHLAAVYGRP